MANQNWIDQESLTVAASAEALNRLNQGSLTVAASAEALNQVAQLSLTVVWGDSVEVETFSDRTDALLRLNNGSPKTIDTGTDSLFGQMLVLTAGEILTEGDILVLYDDSGTTKVRKANASTAGRQDSIAIAMADAAADAAVFIRMMPGAIIPVSFSTVPFATSNGFPVYLSTTNGEASLTSPTSSGDAIIRVGILYGATGINTSPEVIFQPQFIGQIP